MTFFVHPSSIVEPGAQVGSGTKIWHFCHIMGTARIGQNCILGQNVYVGDHVSIGDNVRIQNNVSIYTGVTLEDHVFVGPSAVFTNVINPRSEIDRRHEFQPTRIGRGATIGANATIVCGIELGRYSFVGAGAVVTASLPDFGLAVGVPARLQGWMCRCGTRLSLASTGDPGITLCAACGRRYSTSGDSVIQVDADERPAS